jgi:CoA:oxalate CoA-transferase
VLHHGVVADVTCVEQVGSKGDLMASNPAMLTVVKHSKRRLAVDLRSLAGKAMLDKLLADADVLVENYRPGVIGAMGYSWAAVHDRFPSLIMCSISGFGQTGPVRCSYLSSSQPIDNV